MKRRTTKKICMAAAIGLLSICMMPWLGGAAYGASDVNQSTWSVTKKGTYYSLATITEENIIERDQGCSAYSTSPGSDDDSYMTSMTKVKGKEFSGVAELWGTNLLGKSDITVELGTIGVDSGNFQLVATLDDEIVRVFDNEEMGQTFELKDSNGYFAIRMAGETADFKFYISLW